MVVPISLTIEVEPKSKLPNAEAGSVATSAPNVPGRLHDKYGRGKRSLGPVDTHFGQIMAATRNSTAANDMTVLS
jgi:hypothetical protein